MKRLKKSKVQPKIKMPKKITVDISVPKNKYGGKEAKKISIQGFEVVPGLVVHRNYFRGELSNYYWAIMHIATGLAVIREIESRKLAIQIVREHLAKADWTIKSPNKLTSSAEHIKAVQDAKARKRGFIKCKNEN